MCRLSSVVAAARIVARRWSSACSSNGLACGSAEMSNNIGGRMLVKAPCEPLAVLKTAYSSSWQERRGVLKSSFLCLPAVVFLCNSHISKETAPFGSLEGTLLERSRKGFIAELSQNLEAGSEGQGGRGKCRFIRRFCLEVEGTDIQAIVAAENAIAHLSCEFVRDSLPATA